MVATDSTVFWESPRHGPFTLYVYSYALIIVGQWAT